MINMINMARTAQKSADKGILKNLTYKKVWAFPDFFVFSYEGGDSEFFNYLDSYHRM